VGCFLLTGTGIVPPNDVSLQPDDGISISIDQIGELENQVMVGRSKPEGVR
jgi:2-dehydro-3-deoxy-D-arabinonate dehydratase